MRVLLIKTSSMGDIIHTLPALTDAGRAIPGISFDWVVEDNFIDIPAWHPLVSKAIPVALRRWRKGVFSSETRTGWKQLKRTLAAEKYDLILDAQGLVKSAILTFSASGVRAGLDFSSARESLASFAYQRKFNVNFHQHAIVRMRSLFSQALSYPLPTTPPDFDLAHSAALQSTSSSGAYIPALGASRRPGRDVPQTICSAEQPNEQVQPYVVFLFGTTWASKQWPETYWRQLAAMAAQAGFRVKVGGNHADEIACAERIALGNTAVDVLPRLSISATAHLLAIAAGVVSVDTGFGHLAAALDVPTVSIYGSTNPVYTGALGSRSVHLAADFPCSPCLKRECQFKGKSEVKPACYADVSPVRVWAALRSIIHTFAF